MSGERQMEGSGQGFEIVQNLTAQAEGRPASEGGPYLLCCCLNRSLWG
jgi:hypothetical protein